jgi:hypothetical protein
MRNKCVQKVKINRFRVVKIGAPKNPFPVLNRTKWNANFPLSERIYFAFIFAFSTHLLRIYLQCIFRQPSKCSVRCVCCGSAGSSGIPDTLSTHHFVGPSGESRGDDRRRTLLSQPFWHACPAVLSCETAPCKIGIPTKRDNKKIHPVVHEKVSFFCPRSTKISTFITQKVPIYPSGTWIIKTAG